MKKKYKIIWSIVILVIVVAIIIICVKISNPFFIEKIEEAMPEELNVYSEENIVGKAYAIYRQKSSYKGDPQLAVNSNVHFAYGKLLSDVKKHTKDKKIIEINRESNMIVSFENAPRNVLNSKRIKVDARIFEENSKGDHYTQFSKEVDDEMLIVDIENLQKEKIYYILVETSSVYGLAHYGIKIKIK